MTTVVRRRPLLRAVAIGGGAYFDGLIRIETTSLLESLRDPGPPDSPLPGDARTDRLRFIGADDQRRRNGEA